MIRTQYNEALDVLLPTPTDGVPIATLEHLKIVTGFILSYFGRMNNSCPSAGVQEWARLSDIAKRYNVSKQQAHKWVTTLKERKMIRVQRPMNNVEGENKGDSYYSVPDLDSAFSCRIIEI